MRLSPQGEERFWWVAGLSAALMVSGASLLITIRSDGEKPVPVTNVPKAQPNIGLTRLMDQGGENLVAEEAKYFDPTPLFLPTEWNSDQKTLQASILNDPGRMFQDFPTRLVYAETGLGVKFPEVGPKLGNAPETLSRLHHEMADFGMGRGDSTVQSIPARGGYLEVSSAESGRLVFSQILPKESIPAGNWRPFMMMAGVGVTGLIGPLSFLERSGVEEVDLYFRNYLVQSLHLGERLAPGFYQISVGP